MINNEVQSILFAGVGGQGILKASDITCKAIMEAGFDVKKSEVHGMAQRGGCVTSHVRYGQKVYSPLAEPGKIQTLVAFERMEALRYLNLIKKDAAIIVNAIEIYPPEVNIGDALYPQDIDAFLKKKYEKVVTLNAVELAVRTGSIQTANIVILGALSKLMKIPKYFWEDAIKKSFPKKLVEMNLNAFQLGINV